MKQTIILLMILLAVYSRAEVQLAPVFSDGMVLQQGMTVPLWGDAAAGEKVTINFNRQEISTTTDEQGKWQLSLSPMEYGGPWPMTISAANQLKLTTVYVGDVWICSGQSNMEYGLIGTTDWQKNQHDVTPELRLLKIFGSWEKPSYMASGKWEEASGNQMLYFSGPGYYFGKALYDAIKHPVGLINNSVGATVIESWAPAHALKSTGIDNDGSMYTAKIAPLLPMAIKGVVWYQGEFNVGGDRTYTDKLRLLISSWREAFKQPELPFLIVQLPRNGVEDNPLPAPYPNNDWALLRAAQQAALNVSHTGMALFISESDGMIHPSNKRPLGERLALLARNITYGEKPDCQFVSPLLKGAEFHRKELVLHFTSTEEGFTATDEKISDLFLVDAQGTVTPANATIKKNDIVITLKGVQGVPDVYYNWRGYPMGNLANQAGLPVAPFRLESLKLFPTSCHGCELNLRSNQALADDASLAKSYRIAGYRILKVELLPSKMGVTLTVDKPFLTKKLITVSFPKWKSWDGKSRLANISFPLLPGIYAGNDVLREALLGGLSNTLNPKTIADDPAPVVKKLMPASGKDWNLIKNNNDPYFNLIFQIPKPAEGDTTALTHYYIYSNSTQKVQLGLIGETFQRLYVNGDELLSWSPKAGPGAYDRVVDNVTLLAGWNKVVVQVLRGNWSRFALRVMNNTGGAAIGVSYQAEKPADLH